MSLGIDSRPDRSELVDVTVRLVEKIQGIVADEIKGAVGLPEGVGRKIALGAATMIYMLCEQNFSDLDEDDLKSFQRLVRDVALRLPDGAAAMRRSDSNINFRRDRSALISIAVDVVQKVHNVIADEVIIIQRGGKIPEVVAYEMVVAATAQVRKRCEASCGTFDRDQLGPFLRLISAALSRDVEDGQRERTPDSTNFPIGQLTSKDRERRSVGALSYDYISVPPSAYGMSTPASLRKNPRRK